MSARLSQSERSSRSAETLFILSAAIAASVAAARLDAFEWVCSIAHRFEHVEADELMVAALIFCVAFLCLFLRRDMELRAYVRVVERSHASAICDAHEDELTGLPNRRAFMARLESMLRKQQAFSVLMLDLDGFKSVNDKWGHDAGDEVLRYLASQLKAVTKRTQGTYAARLGGDEFAFLINHDAPAVAPESFAQTLVDLVDSPLLCWRGAPLGASIGIAEHVHGQTAHQIMLEVDKAMYRAKRAGGSRHSGRLI